MPLPLPNLDDRRWADLVEEGRALVPLYAPEWSDHNLHDPGITFIELFAWLAEMDIYQLNQIPDRHKRKFLALVGIHPEPPRPARTVVTFFPKGAAKTLLEGVEVEGNDPFGQPTRFRTLEGLTVITANLMAVQWSDQSGVHDLTRHWQQSQLLSVFGNDPHPGGAFYLGFGASLPSGVPVSLYFTFAGTGTNEDERQRLINEIRDRGECCRVPDPLVTCEKKLPEFKHDAAAVLRHHSARTVWEFYAGSEGWRRLDAANGEVVDDTRSFTLNGQVLIHLPAEMAAVRVGQEETNRFYVRCRFLAGAYDAVPKLVNIAVNGVMAEQAVTPDVPQDLTETLPDEPPVKFERLGIGTGTPWQQVTTRQNPVLNSTFRLFTVENGAWEPWTIQHDFDASGRADRHFLLNPTLGRVMFGDGNKGRVVPANARIVASYLCTRAEAGNVEARTIRQLAHSVHNQDAGTDLESVTVSNPIPATGGAPAEKLEHAEGRAVELMEKPTRAVTLTDYEWFARKTPGVRLARVAVKANVHPAFPCFRAPGMIAVLVMPWLPAKRPMPSQALLEAVTTYLRRQRVIGTRVEVFGPTYLDVSVQAKLQASARASTTGLAQRVAAALNEFFDPLTGGPDGSGWPFGRDVYRSEVLQVIDETEGVDHVLSLELVADGGQPQCGNVCLGPTGLVAAGQHQIEVVS
jgi:Baseplate J-like protein